MHSLSRRFLVLAGAIVLAGLIAMPSQSAVNDVYNLGSGDKLRITVFGEDNISGEFEIDSAGWISMPLIGEVRATGLSWRQLGQAIRERLLDGYLKDPQISGEVLNYRPYFIDGEVEDPGEYPFRQGITVRETVAVAGGFKYWANKKAAFITRRNDASMRKKKVRMDALVHPGDYIWVDD